jgi:hypothetical protein
MHPKLDPALQQLADDVRTQEACDGTPDQVSVLVALSSPPDADDRARLEAAGLKVRSQVGDVLTGSIFADRLEAVAADPKVVAIEGSRPLEPEDDVMTE